MCAMLDFGLAIDHTEERPVTRAGTLDYMAPEVIVCPSKKRSDENKDRLDLAYTDKACSQLLLVDFAYIFPFSCRRAEQQKSHIIQSPATQVDPWSVGILAYELVVGFPPFEHESRTTTLQSIMYSDAQFPRWMSEGARVAIKCRFISSELSFLRRWLRYAEARPISCC